MRRLLVLTVVLPGCLEGAWDEDAFDDDIWFSPAYPEGDGLTFSSGMPVVADGVGVWDGSAVAGMDRMTCELDTVSGFIGADHDLDDDEHVADLTEQGPNRERNALVVGDHGVFFFPVGRDDLIESEPVQGVVHAGLLTAGGYVAVRAAGDDCRLEWRGTGNLSGVDLPAGSCDTGEMAVDRQTGTVWLPSSVGVVRVDRQAWEIVAPDADLVAFDPANGWLYLATVGGNTVRALDVDGGEQWRWSAPGSITALADLGERGGVAVAAQASDGWDVVALDHTATVVGDVKHDRAVIGLAASDSGDWLAVEREHDFGFYVVGD